jgi:hypothetical protein
MKKKRWWDGRSEILVFGPLGGKQAAETPNSPGARLARDQENAIGVDNGEY